MDLELQCVVLHASSAKRSLAADGSRSMESKGIRAGSTSRYVQGPAGLITLTHLHENNTAVCWVCGCWKRMAQGGSALPMMSKGAVGVPLRFLGGRIGKKTRATG